MDHELNGREETMLGAEERPATSMDQISREISRLGRAHQFLFALVGSLAKVLFDLHSRAGCRGNGSRRDKGERASRPIAEERRPGGRRRRWRSW